METTKTILEWLNEIEEPEIREVAINYAKEAEPLFIESSAVRLSLALIRGFYWGDSKEGFKFWDEYYTNLISQGK